MRPPLLALAVLLVACDEPAPVQQEPLTFAPAPTCPAPNTHEAREYQENGGAANAWLWWMTVHHLTQPSYQVVHHYHPAPAVVHYERPARVYRASSPQSAQPVYRAPTPTLKPTTPGRAPAWTARPSQSFGFKPSVSRPASTSFRPSSSSFRSSSPSRGN